jgi:RimJ/RimL family protein N-acetyltransferase
MGIPEIPTLTTERLRLRGLRGSDYEDYAALYADPEVTRFIGQNGETWDRGRAWRHMAFIHGHWWLGGVGMWVVEEKASGSFAGMIGFAEPETWPGFELGGHLARCHWGKGYASEGARAAMAFAFDVLRKDHIISLVDPANHASIRVVERIGEQLEGGINHAGREMLVYGLDRDTYFREIAPRPRLSARRDP